MREKTVDECVGIWIKHGSWDGSNNTCVTSVGTLSVGDYDIFLGGLPENQATQVVNAQEQFRKKLYKILCEVPHTL